MLAETRRKLYRILAEETRPTRRSPDPPIIRGCLGAVGAVRVDRLSILRVVPFGAQPIGNRR